LLGLAQIAPKCFEAMLQTTHVFKLAQQVMEHKQQRWLLSGCQSFASYISKLYKRKKEEKHVASMME